jgi:hypothetical protein
MGTEYVWRTEWLHPKIDANKVGQELNDLSDGPGFDTAEALEWARKHKDSALHKCIDWNNTVAAQRWRLHQMQSVVANIRIEEVHGGEAVFRRQFFNVQGVGYVNRDTVLASEDYSATVLGRAAKDLRNWLHRYSEIQGLRGEVLDSIRDVIQALEDEPALTGSGLS